MISVIIPCYNVSAYVERCFQSLADQTIGIDRLQIIFVDDCSTDDTYEKLLQIEKRYPEQVILIQSETNGRQGTARNIGLSYAQGEWIFFLDADDWMEPHAIEKLYSYANASDYDIVVADSVRDPEQELRYFSKEELGSGDIIEYCIDTDTKRRQLIRENNLSFSACGRLIRKRFLMDNDIFFLENYAYEDIYWGSLINYYVKKFCVIKENLYHYYINPASTVLSTADYHTDLLTVNALLWNEVRKRGFWEDYRAEIEYEFIYSGVLAFWKVLALRYEKPPYSLYGLLGVFAQEHLPEPKSNPYYDTLPEFYRLMLDSLYISMRKAEFFEFVENIRRIGL